MKKYEIHAKYTLPKKMRESACEHCKARDDWYGRAMKKKHKTMLEMCHEIASLYKLIRKLFGFKDCKIGDLIKDYKKELADE